MGDYFFDTNIAEAPIDRVDGKDKVTGSAKFSAEYNLPGLAYGVLTEATIAKGVIASIDSKAAENAPGVLAVITHLNCPKLPGYESTAADIAKQPESRRGFRVFTDNIIRFNNQPIALVVADTFERATYAASLIKASYEKGEHLTDLEHAIKIVAPLEGANFNENVRGEVDAWKNAEVKIEATYTMPIEVHHPMELHAITVKWDSADSLTVYEKTQTLSSTQQNIARIFGIKSENVRVITQFVGGAFGSAFNTWPHSVAALIGAKVSGKPVKLMVTRSEMFTMVGYRPAAIQTIGIGATKDGRLTGITHDAKALTATYAVFTEGIVNGSRGLYNCPNVTTRYKVYPLNLSQPTWMRGPGETTGAFGLECAIDELSYALNMDPLELRLKNYAETDPESKKPYSSKFLKEAYQLGRDKIKWDDRNRKIGSMKEGDWLIGYGMGTGIFNASRNEAKVGALFLPDGTLILRSGVTDMGPGTATAMVKLASDVFGIPASKIKFELGDSNYPPGPAQGGSGTMSALGTAVNNVCVNIKKKLVDLVKDKSIFHTEQVHAVKPEDIVFENGFMVLATDRSKKISFGDAMNDAGVKQIEMTEMSERNPKTNFAAFSYAVHFVKVKVHPKTGEVKVIRAVSAIDAGKVINQKTAESQIVGSVVWGISMALMEEGVIDHRYGRWVNNNFADYHVAVNADIPEVEVLFVDKPDPLLNPQGAKGIGEVGLVGFAAAVCNAVYHATGKRVRELPITRDKII